MKKLFETAHLNNDLRSKSIRGGAINIGSRGTIFVLNLFSTAILARLLTPDDFGLIAMVMVLVGFIQIFGDLGLPAATIQREEITHEQVSAMFWINLIVSALFALVTIAAAPALVLLYEEERLFSITAVLCLTFIFSGLTAQHLALMRRQMRFKAIAIIDLTAFSISILSGVIFALIWQTYWALVVMTLSRTAITMVSAWLFSGWRPGRFSWSSEIRSMLGFGGYLTGADVLNYFSRNFDKALVGVVFGAGSLGLYTKAYNLLMLPVSLINRPIGSVALSSLSRLQGDPVRHRRFFLRAVSLLALVTIPLITYFLVDADVIILLLLGDQWVEAIEIFRWLGLAAVVSAVNIIPGWLCTSLGRNDIPFKWALYSMPFIIIGFLIGLFWGMNGVAASFSITFTISFLVFVSMACRISSVMEKDLWHAIRYTVSSSVLSGLCLILFKHYIPIYETALLFHFCTSLPLYGMMFLLFYSISRSGREELIRLYFLKNEFRIVTTHPPQVKNKTISVIAVDDLKMNNLSLIQLDVEGYELNALIGAKNTILKWFLSRIQLGVLAATVNLRSGKIPITWHGVTRHFQNIEYRPGI
ncbi:MAG: oligosaccharide flippase family protein, partial [gamma proteobacterium symbiont of Phacoides pectinatus]